MQSELAPFESAATRYLCQMLSAPAVNRTRRVGCAAKAQPDHVINNSPDFCGNSCTLHRIIPEKR